MASYPPGTSLPPPEGKTYPDKSPPQIQYYTARSFGRCIYLPCKMDWVAEEEKSATVGNTSAAAAAAAALVEEIVCQVEEKEEEGNSMGEEKFPELRCEGSDCDVIVHECAEERENVDAPPIEDQEDEGSANQLDLPWTFSEREDPVAWYPKGHQDEGRFTDSEEEIYMKGLMESEHDEDDAIMAAWDREIDAQLYAEAQEEERIYEVGYVYREELVKAYTETQQEECIIEDGLREERLRQAEHIEVYADVQRDECTDEGGVRSELLQQKEHVEAPVKTQQETDTNEGDITMETWEQEVMKSLDIQESDMGPDRMKVDEEPPRLRSDATTEPLEDLDLTIGIEFEFVASCSRRFLDKLSEKEWPEERELDRAEEQDLIAMGAYKPPENRSIWFGDARDVLRLFRKGLRDAGLDAVCVIDPSSEEELDYSKWIVTFKDFRKADESSRIKAAVGINIEGIGIYLGVEVKTPIIQLDDKGQWLVNIDQALRTIMSDLRVCSTVWTDKLCGMNVHVGKADRTPFSLLTLQNLVVLWGLYDGPLGTLQIDGGRRRKQYADTVRNDGRETNSYRNWLAAIEGEYQKSKGMKERKLGIASSNKTATGEDGVEEGIEISNEDEGREATDDDGEREGQEPQAHPPHKRRSPENLVDETTDKEPDVKDDDAWTQAVYACKDEAELFGLMGKFKHRALTLINHVKDEAHPGRGDRFTLEFREHPGTLLLTDAKFWVLFATGMVRWAQTVADNNLTVNASGSLELNDLFTLIDFPEEGKEHFERSIKQAAKS